jgi:hypothetical protein
MFYVAHDLYPYWFLSAMVLAVDAGHHKELW